MANNKIPLSDYQVVNFSDEEKTNLKYMWDDIMNILNKLSGKRLEKFNEFLHTPLPEMYEDAKKHLITYREKAQAEYDKTKTPIDASTGKRSSGGHRLATKGVKYVTKGRPGRATAISHDAMLAADASNYLEHYGILKMKWGHRNGPPYPLTPNQHSKAELQANERLAKAANAEDKAIKAKHKAEKAQAKAAHNTNENKQAKLDQKAEKATVKYEKLEDLAKKSSDYAKVSTDNLRAQNEYLKARNEQIRLEKEFKQMTAKGESAVQKALKQAVTDAGSQLVKSALTKAGEKVIKDIIDDKKTEVDIKKTIEGSSYSFKARVDQAKVKQLMDTKADSKDNKKKKDDDEISVSIKKTVDGSDYSFTTKLDKKRVNEIVEAKSDPYKKQKKKDKEAKKAEKELREAQEKERKEAEEKEEKDK